MTVIGSVSSPSTFTSTDCDLMFICKEGGVCVYVCVCERERGREKERERECVKVNNGKNSLQCDAFICIATRWQLEPQIVPQGLNNIFCQYFSL